MCRLKQAISHFGYLNDVYVMKEFLVFLSVSLVILSSSLQSLVKDSKFKFPQDPPSYSLGLCGDFSYVNKVRSDWFEFQPKILENLNTSKNIPSALYQVEIQTHPLFWYAEHCKDNLILHSLMELFLSAAILQTKKNDYVYYYRGLLRKQTFKLDKNYFMWVTGAKKRGEESVLSSSQFLAMASDIARYIGTKPSFQQSSIEKQFLITYLPILTSHYERWVIQSPGIFQGRGWGCKYNHKYVKTAMSHIEYMHKKKLYIAGDSDSPNHCNAVTDSDLWIISGVSNLVWLQDNTPIKTMVPSHLTALKSYLQNAYTLIESRIDYGTASNFEDKIVQTAVFDVGVWDNHQTYQYAGLEDLHVYDYFKLQTPKPAHNIGWDISHGIRFFHVFETLKRNRLVVRSHFPSDEFMNKFSNQFAFKVFNKNLAKPLFSNYWDGANGWHRVGYSGREGYGIPPYGYSSAAFFGGYGLWGKYNPNIHIIMKSLNKMVGSKNVDIQNHLDRYYNHFGYSKAKFVKSYDLMLQNDEILKQHIPALVFSNPETLSGLNMRIGNFIKN